MSLLNLIKTVYRLFRYKAEWKKQFREVNIRKTQNASIRKIDPQAEKLIVFFIPGAEYNSGKESISGGLISIVSLAQETSLIYKETSVQVLCATYYKEHLIFRLSSFINETQVFNPLQIESYFSNLKDLILHIPELYAADFVQNHQKNIWFSGINSIHINILNQNIQLMPDHNVLNELKSNFSSCTITTAHKKYCNPHYRNLYGIPLHELSVWISPENYLKRSGHEKENLILFSPDNKELTERLISFIRNGLPSFKFQVIQGLNYEEYKELISRAKFLITTGEGLDAYFIETYFSGGVAFAIKNLNFFDEKYLKLPCLFENQENLEKLLQTLIEKYENVEEYNQLNSSVSKLLAEDYSYKTYQKILGNFITRSIHMPNPFFTVITVTYNSSQFVRDAIESVLASTFTDFELIIGDDCSTDNTWEIINEYNDSRIVKYRNETNLREYPNRNKAINLARGEWVIFIDGDDVIFEHGLLVFSEYICAHPDVSMVIQKNYLNNVIWPIKVSPKQFLINEFFGNPRLSCSSFASNVFRRDSILTLGGLSNDFKTGDEDFRLRMGSNFKTLFIAGWLTWPRETPGQASRSIKISTLLIERYNQINNLLNNDTKDKEVDGIIINGAQSFQIFIRKTWMNFIKTGNFKDARVIYKYFGFKKSVLKSKKPLKYVDVLTSQTTTSPLKWRK